MNPCNKDVTMSYVAGLKMNSRCDSPIIRSTNPFRTNAQPDLEQRTARLPQEPVYPVRNLTGPVYKTSLELFSDYMNIPILPHPLSLEKFILPNNNISIILNEGVFLK